MPLSLATRRHRLETILQAEQRQRNAPDAAQDALWRESLWDWAIDQVQTVDEASKGIRLFPGEKAYLHDLLTLFQTEQLLAVPKSRRMLVSWAVAVYLTWTARYSPHRLMLVQSATEQKAAYLVGERCRFIEDHLRDDRYRRAYTSWRTKQGLTGKLLYTRTQSQILSVAQGADVVRSYTFSFLCMDEVEFQQEGRAALVAALPAVEKGAQIVLVSTSDGPQGPLASLCKDVGFHRWS